MQKIQTTPDFNGRHPHEAESSVFFVDGVAYVTDGHPLVGYATQRPGAYRVSTAEAVPLEYAVAADAMRKATSVRVG
jgi:hypothetical protein